MPLRRSSVIADDVLMTPPLRSIRRGSDDVESYILSTPYESSIDTMSYCRTLELPPTPKSTTNTFQQLMETPSIDLKKKVLWDRFVDHNVDSYTTVVQQQLQKNCPSSLLPTLHWIHDDGALAQTEERRGSKADAADLFIMTKPVESTCISMHKSRRSTWWLCSKDPVLELSWLDKTFSYFTKRKGPEKVCIFIYDLFKLIYLHYFTLNVGSYN